MEQPQDTSPDRAWRFPFARGERLGLTRSQWMLFIGFVVLMHVAGLSVARWTGTFVALPNGDHTPSMEQIMQRGYPVNISVPPGFGYYLALKTLLTRATGVPYWWGKYFPDVLLVLASGVLSILLAFRLTKNTVLSVVSGLTLLCAPIYILGVGMEEAAIVFLPVFLLALLCAVKVLQADGLSRLRWILLAGLLTGISALIRGNSQFLLAALLPVAWTVSRGPFRKRAFATTAFAALFVAGQACAMLPWTLVQRSAGREGIGSMPTMYQSYFDGFTRHRGNRVVEDLMRDYEGPERSMRGVINFNLRWLREDPAALLSLYALKFARAWYMSDSGRWDRPTLLLHLPFWIVALIGVFRWRRQTKGDAALLFLLAVIGYMWFISGVMGGIARYSASLYGFIGIFCGVALLPVWERIRLRRARAV